MTEPTHLNPRPAQDIDFGAIGRSAWAAYTVAHGFDLDHPDALPWDLVDEATRDAWVAAGRAAVNAYDAQLTGQADAQAETLLNGPEKQPQADSGPVEGDAWATDPDLDPVQDEAEPEHVEPDPHENPADAYAKALAAEQSNTTEHN